MQTHNFMATYQTGIVSAVDPVTHEVRCKIPALDDLETAWLPFLTQNSGGNQFYCLPDLGELAVLLLDARGEGGCVIGTIFNAQDSTPTTDNNIWKKQFSNGTVIEHNRSNGDLIIHTSGKVVVNNSPVQVNNGTVTVTDGDVIADGVSLKNHVHDGVTGGKDKTKKPAD